MITERLDVLCPNCRQSCDVRFAIDEKKRTSPTWFDINETDVMCPCCAWEFVVNQEGEIVDDGEVEQDAVFEVNDEGELCTEEVRSYRCPHCQHLLEGETPGCVPCPWCHWLVETREELLSPDPNEDEWDYEDECGWYEEVLGGLDVCPHCLDDEGLDSDLRPLNEGWMKCLDCGCAFWNPNLWGQARANSDEYDWDVGATKIFTDPLKLQGERLVLRDRTFSKGIRIEDSRVILERCIIEGGQFAAVDVTGAHAKVLLRGCRIQGSGTGVRINDRAMVRMIDCEVTNHPENGILVRGGSWLRVRKSRIHHNGLDGLCSVGANSVFVHRSEIMDNCRVAIHLDGGRSVMTHTRISGPHKIGLKLGDHGRFILRNVDIRECSQVGLEAEQSSKILAVDSSICQQGGVGLSVQSKSRVRLRKCRIRDNHIGIQLSDTATLALRACETQGNQDRDWQIEPGARIIQSTT